MLEIQLMEGGNSMSVTYGKGCIGPNNGSEKAHGCGLWLLAQRWSATQVAEALEREPHTIGNWLDNFRQGGAQGLVFEQTGGSPPS